MDTIKSTADTSKHGGIMLNPDGTSIGGGAPVYSATPPTYTDGQTVVPQADAAGNLKTSQATLLAGEDLVNDVIKVEQRYSFVNITTATTTVVKSGAGFLHLIVVNKHVATGIITIYDNTAGSGTLIGTITVGAALLTDPPVTSVYDVSFSTGLTIVTSQAENLTVSYR